MIQYHSYLIPIHDDRHCEDNHPFCDKQPIHVHGYMMGVMQFAYIERCHYIVATRCFEWDKQLQLTKKLILDNLQLQDDESRMKELAQSRIEHDIDRFGKIGIDDDYCDDHDDIIQIEDLFSHLKVGDRAIITLGMELPRTQQWKQELTILLKLTIMKQM